MYQLPLLFISNAVTKSCKAIPGQNQPTQSSVTLDKFGFQSTTNPQADLAFLAPACGVLDPDGVQSDSTFDTSELSRMLSPSSVKQIPVRSSLQQQPLSRIGQIWLPVDSKSTGSDTSQPEHVLYLPVGACIGKSMSDTMTKRFCFRHAHALSMLGKGLLFVLDNFAGEYVW